MKTIIWFTVLFFSFKIYSQKINIGLYAENKVKKINLLAQSGYYYLFCDTILIGRFNSNNLIEIDAGENKLTIQVGNSIHYAKSVSFKPEKYSNYFKIKPTNPDLKSRNYEGEIQVNITNKNYLKIINTLEINDYLEGVVECEAGTGQFFEFYKTQAIISRTFALKNWNKHEKDGFNLCDQVHCQAYFHKRNSLPNLIDSAVLLTNNKILITLDSTFAATNFHANCGGQISDPEWVWNTKMDGLYSFKDNYCVNSKQANWTKSIPLTKWSEFFKYTYDAPVNDSSFFYWMTNFNQSQRLTFFINPVFGIPLRDIREKFNLKSTFFSVKLIDDQVVITGKGFGHGVGLCQEGGMNMAKKGFTAEEILNYYFPNARLENLEIIHN